MLELCIATGWSIEYVESLTFEQLAEFKALNILQPFTSARQSHQLGVIASMLSHKVYKKGLTAVELFPYLSDEVPEYLEDAIVTKARRLYKTIQGAPASVQPAQLNVLRKSILESIDEENEKDSPNEYIVNELTKIANSIKRKG